MSRDGAMARARALARELEARGVPVSIEIMQGRPGTPNGRWFDTRFVGSMGHHIVSRRSMGQTPGLALVKRGRPDVPGPLCNAYLGFDGRARIICMGWANHPGAGGPYTLPGGRIPKDQGRPYLFGWEIEGGLSEADWPPSFRTLMGKCHAATLAWLRRDERSHIEHFTWAPRRKIDRLGYTLSSARAEARPHLGSTPPPKPPPPEQEDDMPYRDWPKADRDALISDLRSALLFDRTYDYVNPKSDPTSVRHQIARAHQNGHNTSRSSWIDRLARAVALIPNGTSGKTLSLHIRRGDLSEARFTSRVSGNPISAATSILNAQEKATEARDETRETNALVRGLRSMVEALSDRLDGLVPGIADAVRETAAEVARQEAATISASDVADQLEVVVAAEDHDGEAHDAQVLAEKAADDASADAELDAADAADDDEPSGGDS